MVALGNHLKLDTQIGIPKAILEEDENVRDIWVLG
jgi:hypothetical protein